MDKKYTTYQRLLRVLSGGNDNVHPIGNQYTIRQTKNDIIDTASSVEEYDMKVLQAKQQKLLARQWTISKNDIANRSLAGLNDVKLMYRDADLMDGFPEIGTALDIVMEEACVSGNTRIKLLNGEIKTFDELFKENKNNFWCYSVDEDGQIKPSLIEKIIYKGEKPIYEILLDDNTLIECTDNHQWMMSDKTWKTTLDLKVNDSLMSIYDKLNYLGYEKVKSTVENKSRLTHRIVAEELLHDDKIKLSINNNPYQKIVIHHTTFNKLNNDPSYLQYMLWNDHQKLHTDLNSKRWEDEKFANKMRKIFSDTVKKTWREQKESLCKNLSIAQKARYSKMTDDERIRNNKTKGEKNGMYNIHRYGKDNPNFYHNKKHIDDISEKEFLDYLKTLPISTKFNYRDALSSYFNTPYKEIIKYNALLCKKYNVKKILSLRVKIDENLNIDKLKEYVFNGYTRNEICKKCNITKHNIDLVVKGNGYKHWTDFLEHGFNHKIISITKTNRIDRVYDAYNASCNHSYAIKCNNGHIISHNCFINENGMMINVSSKSERVKSILEDLFVNRLSLHMILPMVCRSMCKYGNTFMLLNTVQGKGIVGWKELPVYEIERYENGMMFPYQITNSNAVDVNKLDDTKFVWVGSSNQATCYQNFQIAHFRLLYDSLLLPYGVSFLNKARRHFRMLSMMEDMMLIYRLDRSVERRIFKINVGAIDAADVPAYVQEIANNFKRTPIIDPLTGQIDTRKNIMNQMEDFFIPFIPGQDYNPIETLAAGQNLTAMDDIKFIQNKIVTALRVPKSFLNFEEAQGDGKNLSLLDVRFTRTVNRIQQALLTELNKIAIIHLFLLGFTDELTNFKLTMNNPSSQAEMLELENLAKKVTTAKDAVSDPGGGIPLTSMTWAWKHIFKWSDKEIQQNLEEIRLETALAIELQKTMQIIKKTGLFDPVDNIYGEPGAEYSEGMPGEDGDMGSGASGGGGGMPVGSGDLDFGDADGEMEDMGAEGEMDMNTAADENANVDANQTNNDMSGNLGEMFIKNINKELLTEKKRINQNNDIKKKHYNELYYKRLTEKLLNKINNETKLPENVPLYDKTFFINESLNKLSEELKEISE